jgi:aryl-alcohol dehydrogenase-like predicted oxidoreductase
MNYRSLGKSSLKISAVGFGCMSLGDKELDASRLIHRALDTGINFFDTADLYDKGLNEQMVGRILRPARDRVVLATKVGNQWRPDGSGWDWNPRKDSILKAADASLTRLQTDRIDLYQLHGGTVEDPIDEIIEAFEYLQQQGKILYYGISSIRPDVIREYVRRSSLVSIMMQYSALDRRPEESCLGLLHTNHIGVLARGAIGKGLLAGKLPAPYLNYPEADVRKMAAAVQSASGERRSPAQTALQFVLENPAVTSVVAGLRTMAQLEEAVKTGDVARLTETEMRVLREAIPVNFYEEHR